MKSSTFLLCALLAAPLAVPVGVLAVPAAKTVAPPAPPAMAQAEPHNEDDGHDHQAASVKSESLTDYLWRRSDVAFHDGDYQRAVDLHRAIVTADSHDVESYGVGAWLLWSMDKKAEADAFIAQGLKNNPQSAEMWDTAAQHYGLEKRGVEERDAYFKAVELAGNDADQMLRRRLAHAQEHAGDLQASATVWRALVQDFPGDVVNKNNLARVEAEMAKTNDKTDAKTMGALGLGALLMMGAAWRGKRRAA